MSEALVRQQVAIDISREMTVDGTVAMVAVVKDILKRVMVPDVHYGVIPGTPKPTLYQPGAEKIGLTFGLAPEYEVEDQSDRRGWPAFKVTCRIKHAASGLYRAEAVRICSWREPSFRWRRATEQEYNAAPVDARQFKEKLGKGGGTYNAYLVESDPWEAENAVLSRAQKRAHVAAIKTATAASDLFAELDEAGDHDKEKKPEIRQPKARAATTESAGSSDPGESQGQGASTYVPRIPAEVWSEINAQWHRNGAISDKQRARLFAIAGKAGWTSEQVGAELETGLGITATEIAWGKPYDAIVKLFESPWEG